MLLPQLVTSSGRGAERADLNLLAPLLVFLSGGGGRGDRMGACVGQSMAWLVCNPVFA